MTQHQERVPVPMEVHKVALARVKSSLSKLPNHRLSQDRLTISEILGWFEDNLDGYPNDSRQRIITLLRSLSESDDDVRGVLRDFQALVNSGLTYSFIGGNRAVKAAKEEINDFETRFFPEGGGLDGFINNQVGECILAGASSVEWVPQRDRRGVKCAIVVPAEEIRIRRDPNTLDLVYRQTNFLGSAELNPLTYCYQALTTSGKNPHGVPMFISAIFSLDRKMQILRSEQRVINLMSRGALVAVTVPRPTPEELGFDTIDSNGYLDAVGKYYEEVANLMVAGTENGIYVGPDGTEIKITAISQSGTGASEIVESNSFRVWNALGTVPFLRGKLDSTTQALAQVIIPIVHAEALMIQRTIIRQLEWGLNLHLRLKGIASQVYVKFNLISSPFIKEEAEAFRIRAEGHRILTELIGPAYLPTLMTAYDITEDDFNNAPSWWERPSTNQNTNSNSPNGGNSDE